MQFLRVLKDNFSYRKYGRWILPIFLLILYFLTSFSSEKPNITAFSIDGSSIHRENLRQARLSSLYCQTYREYRRQEITTMTRFLGVWSGKCVNKSSVTTQCSCAG